MRLDSKLIIYAKGTNAKFQVDIDYMRNPSCWYVHEQQLARLVGMQGCSTKRSERDQRIAEIGSMMPFYRLGVFIIAFAKARLLRTRRRIAVASNWSMNIVERVRRLAADFEKIIVDVQAARPNSSKTACAAVRIVS